MKKHKPRIGLLFGGPGMEHAVSCLSGATLFKHLDRQLYTVVAIGWHRQGGFHASEQIADLLENPGDPKLGCIRRYGPCVQLESLGLSAIFPTVHGTGGEDGVLQGHLDLLGIPYAGSGVLGSALCMHKGLCKSVLQEEGIPVTPWITVRRGASLPPALQDQTFPCFVKPASGGSSVGVSKVKNSSELRAALDIALHEFPEVLVEPAIDARELECAVLAGEASGVGEIVCHHEFYSYEAKYVDPKGASTLTHPVLPVGVDETIRALSEKAFQVCHVRDFARVDFFFDRTSGGILLNEINTHPGFTAISMFPKLWEERGVPLRDQLQRILKRALETPSSAPPS